MKTLVTGFPRIGQERELKKTLESYWKKNVPLEHLEAVSAGLRKKHWEVQKESGVDFISCNDFSWYDQMLDTVVMAGAEPPRFQHLTDKIERYFAMARGTDRLAPLEMTKWFNTNYHYLVPELTAQTRFSADFDKIRKEYNEAVESGIRPKINVIGPLTFLALSRMTDGSDWRDLADSLTDLYGELIEEIGSWSPEPVVLQLEEPYFVKDPQERDLRLLASVYKRLNNRCSNVRILFSTYFEHSVEAVEALADTGIWGAALDFVHGINNLQALNSLGEMVLVAGVVDGRNIWKTDTAAALSLIDRLAESCPPERLILSSSCSLQHVPYSLEKENLGPLLSKLCFAVEKCRELAGLSALFRRGESGAFVQRSEPDLRELFPEEECRRSRPFEQRKEIQKNRFNLPLLPTTTIGSFPQTPELRKLRREYRQERISENEYRSGIKSVISQCIDFQKEIGLDVFVHGEGERTDMVEYFGEQLDGFAFTSNGWVQSYGSRCVKPPVLYGPVRRPRPMTVDWINYARSLTDKPVKGMLTGPVTILNWSFVRNDISPAEVAREVALSLREEIADLERSGIGIIQVDEAALKEGYPLRRNKRDFYEKWAVGAFRLTVGGALPETQIHTHMCYSDFNDIIGAIEAMDADVITIENVRSANRLLSVFRDTGYRSDIGPGVYDIHSPRIPDTEEIEANIRKLLSVFRTDQLWVNPDCGLKTRRWEEAGPALRNMVAAVGKVRQKLNDLL